MTDLIKTDGLGRITVARESREAILDAFEASSMSGLAFAKEHGINYQTFASWMQKRRRARGDYEKRKKTPPKEKTKLPQLTLTEVSIEQTEPSPVRPLKLSLAGEVSVTLEDESQLPLLKELIKTLSPESPC